MSFYIHLPSNGSQNYFPSNKISNYKIKTPVKIECKQWEYSVGLTEISYICSLRTLTGSKDDNIITIDVTGNSILQNVELPKICYRNIQHLVDTINSAIPACNSVTDCTEQYAKYLSCEYDKLKKLVKMTVANCSKLTISSKLSYILGFDGVTSFRTKLLTRVINNAKERQIYTSTEPPNLMAGAYNMFIYSDIVEPQMVGSELVPLLRVISLSGDNSAVTTKTFSHPYYMPIARNNFDTISVVICNEYGEEIVFDKGMVNITLHFKKNE
jgi:hypothetical protein